jgi:hypothetical protein
VFPEQMVCAEEMVVEKEQVLLPEQGPEQSFVDPKIVELPFDVVLPVVVKVPVPSVPELLFPT